MRVSDAMTRDVRLIDPDNSLLDAARIMAEAEIGALPVRDNDRLIGVVTDRDIVVRALAQGKTADTKVRDVMSQDVKYCYEDEDLDEVAINMADIQVRRLPVLSRDKRLVGILSLCDVATHESRSMAGKAIYGISERESTHTYRGSKPH
ncbi:CBS domain-containing protein [Crenobacter sp. SG2303]|uniref:CBS domain-containing protein n=1 Tax=Crenobacter oryzisoli TaxID=3056844 RepID=A0ABT7XS54_9NEIS|nr:CBS domain-containing protein [Crenobacter sp. SG2303]MDN0076618.1 CBS domain-containing protein [Crenobacter sp. SG2303]